MNKIVVAADLGHFRAYKLSETASGKWKTDLIRSHDSAEGQGKLSETLSDSAGRFPGGGGESEKVRGYGEPHNLETELQKKLSRRIARDINSLIKKEEYTAWCLAAPAKINGIIVSHLKPEVKTALIKNVVADLTKVKKAEIAGYFL
jgi:hypothetical protein